MLETEKQLIQERRFTEAEAQLNQIVLEYPSHSDAWQLLGSALAQQNKLPEAITAFERAVLLVPNESRAHFNLGVALQMAGRTDEARESLQKTLVLDPGNQGAQQRLQTLVASLEGVVLPPASLNQMATVAQSASVPEPPPSLSALSALSSLASVPPRESLPPAPPSYDMPPPQTYLPPPVAPSPGYGVAQRAPLNNVNNVNRVNPDEIPAGKMALGVVVGMIFGGIGVALWWVIMITLRIGFASLACMGVGWAIGMGMRLGCGGGGSKPAVAAAIVAVLMILPTVIIFFLLETSNILLLVFGVLGLVWGTQRAYNAALPV